MKLLKKTTISFAFFSLLAIIAWFFVTQPILEQNTTTWKKIVNQDLLQNHVKTLSEILPKRSAKQNKLNLSANYIYQQLKKYSPDVQFQKFSVAGMEYQNIIAKFGPKFDQNLYIVGAHYDSYKGRAGADDNASGVAAIIEMARLFSLKPPPVAVQLVAYTLEEPPYFATHDMGSYYHAKSLSDNNTNVKLMLSIEMIGYFTEQENSQNYPISIMKYAYPKTGNYIAVAGSLSNFNHTRFIKKNMRLATPLPVYSINAPAFIQGIDFSDHRNYSLFGFPAIMITDTAFYRNRNYHQKTDTWEKLNYSKMAMVVQAIYHSLLDHMQSY